MIKENTYGEYRIYSLDFRGEVLGKRIADREYVVLEIYKDTERNYVAKVEIEGDYYVLKSPKAETVIPQRRVQTLFKRGEALTSLINLEGYREKGMDDFIVPRAVLIKRKCFIEESFILMDHIEGEKLSTKEDIDEVIRIAKKIHGEGIYHGDLNTSNFIKTEDGIKIIDTQGKREKFWNFKRSYDILSLKRDKLVEMLHYDVEKSYPINRFSLGYIVAHLLKEFKYTPFIKKVREIKKNLRKKGWKI